MNFEKVDKAAFCVAMEIVRIKTHGDYSEIRMQKLIEYLRVRGYSGDFVAGFDNELARKFYDYLRRNGFSELPEEFS